MLELVTEPAEEISSCRELLSLLEMERLREKELVLSESGRHRELTWGAGTTERMQPPMDTLLNAERREKEGERERLRKRDSGIFLLPCLHFLLMPPIG